MMLQKKQYASTASLLGVVLTFLALLVAWQSPLLSTPTVEAALFLGMFLAPVSFMAGVSRGSFKNPAGFSADTIKELTWIGTPTAFYLFIIWLHSWSVESCSPSFGVFPFLIVLLPQLVLCVATGIAFGRIIGIPKVANILGLLMIAAYLLVQGVLWWLAPSMRFFDLYWFFVGGDLLGGQALDPAIITYRLSALLYAFAIIALGTHWKKHFTKFWAVFGFVVCAVLLHSHSYTQISPSLTDREIDYPDVLESEPFVLHTDFAAIGKENAEAILQESAFWYERLKQRTGLKISGKTQIWLYESPEALAKYTGAKHVHFTLPSHREIHISSTEVPHPTLGHEIAHVILGEASTTIWGVPGLWGLLPNWGLSEGLATLLTPELSLRDDLTLKQQAVALFKLGFEKNPDALLDNDPWSFWIQSSGRAYVLSAAFLEDFIGNRPKMVVKIARAGSLYLSDVQRKNILDGWKNFELPSDALNAVSQSYASNSILTAVCKNGVETLNTISRKSEDNLSFEQQPVHKQRELLIRQSLPKDTSYAKAALEILNRKPSSITEAAAAYGKLGLALKNENEGDSGKAYALYLLARVEVLSGNFDLGQTLMPKNLEGLLGLEAMRLYGLARAETGFPDEAAGLFQELQARSSRSADKIKFADLAERSLAVARGQKYLLGVWRKAE